jgi:hypothetical protein
VPSLAVLELHDAGRLYSAAPSELVHRVPNRLRVGARTPYRLSLIEMASIRYREAIAIEFQQPLLQHSAPGLSISSA